MKERYIDQYSHHLNREMGISVYGHAGRLCLVFPPQNGKHQDWKSFGMIDAVADEIERGKIQLFCCDSIDEETWSDLGGDPRRRIERQEAYFHYICDELVPLIRDIHAEDCGMRGDKLMVTGTSMGGYHAVNVFMRRPDLFDQVLSLSGLFQSDYFFHDYHDDLTYANSPLDFLPNMSTDHPYIQMYNARDIILCCGQGAWEDEAKKDAWILKEQFERLAVPAWIDFWGEDVNHDWPWWEKQFPYFVGKLLEG